MTESILRRCHRCGMHITDGEPYEVDEFGWKHTIECSWGSA